MRKYGLILHKVIHNMHLCLCKSLHCFKTNEVFLGVHRLVPHRGSYRSPVKKIKMDY